MRISNAAHEARPWRIREIAPDFKVEDVRALPVHGGAEDFQTLLEIMVSLDPGNSESLPTRILWGARDRLGAWFDLGRVSAPIDHGRTNAGGELPIPGTARKTHSAIGCQRICTIRRRTSISSPRLSRPSIVPTTNTPRNRRTEPCTSYCT